MDKRIKAAMAGLAFVAGCEIGIALQLVKMIHNYTDKEAASKEPIEDVIKKSEIPDDPETETDAEIADAEPAETDEAEDTDANPSGIEDTQAAFAN